ncbi:MAG TPA: zinc ribbon domain-containing protein [Solirubrobacteraceae bacterium]
MPEQVHVASAERQPSPILPRHDRCPACDATLALDQRYCVECGQRCGAARPPFTGVMTQGVQPAPSSQSRSGRPRSSVNSTLIAGIGTLLLAMGVGVLIGRSGTDSSAKLASPAVQVVTVPGAGAAAAPSTEPQTSTNAAPTTKSSGASSGATAKRSAGAASKKATPAPVKSVKVGTPGKGPGYQKGHFTGNFFGE